MAAKRIAFDDNHIIDHFLNDKYSRKIVIVGVDVDSKEKVEISIPYFYIKAMIDSFIREI